MARVIRFHYPLSFRPASKPRPAQGTRGKLIQLPPVAYRPSRGLQYRIIVGPVGHQVENRTGSPENAATLNVGP